MHEWYLSDASASPIFFFDTNETLPSAELTSASKSVYHWMRLSVLHSKLAEPPRLAPMKKAGHCVKSGYSIEITMSLVVKVIESHVPRGKTKFHRPASQVLGVQ